MITKDIDSLCRRNNIEYYLLGGSAIGAIRHNGFIPWDDDLDIIMTNENYEKFLSVCREELDKEKYYLQVGLTDWPLNFSKIKLRGTILEEIEGFHTSEEMRGIFVDIFKMDYVSSNPIIGRWQYFCGKYDLCYQLSQRRYNSASLKKKMMIFLSLPLKLRFVREFIIKQTTRYNKQTTDKVGFLYGRTRWKSAIVEKRIFGKPKYVSFEDTKLPVAEHYHEYLTQVFGNYMQLPPKEQQVGLHLINVDFGKY